MRYSMLVTDRHTDTPAHTDTGTNTIICHHLSRAGNDKGLQQFMTSIVVLLVSRYITSFQYKRQVLFASLD